MDDKNEDKENEKQMFEYFNQMEDWDVENTPFGKHKKRVKRVEILLILLCASMLIFIEFEVIKTGDFLAAVIIFLIFGSMSWLYYRIDKRIKSDTENRNSKEKM